MTTSKISEAGPLLASYSSWMWSCGATSVRIDKNLRRMASAFGLEAELTVQARYVSLAVSDSVGGEASVFTSPMKPGGVNFDLNTELSSLSWQVSDRRLSIDETRTRFESIVGRRYANGWHICLLTSLANASFCRLFGGDGWAMTIVFAATLAGYYIKQLMLRAHLDLRFTFFVCALVSTVLCAGATMVGPTATPSIALATSVLYLIPGVPYINAASDLIDRHYLCSVSRFIDAVVLTAMLSAGMCCGLALMKMNVSW